MQKLTGEVARDLFRYVRKCVVHAHVLDPRSTSAVELWQQLSSTKIAKLNPKLEVRLEQSSRPIQPFAMVEFVDGNSIKLDTADMEVRALRWGLNACVRCDVHVCCGGIWFLYCAVLFYFLSM